MVSAAAVIYPKKSLSSFHLIKQVKGEKACMPKISKGVYHLQFRTKQNILRCRNENNNLKIQIVKRDALQSCCYFLVGSLGSCLVFANVMVTQNLKHGSVPFPQDFKMKLKTKTSTTHLTTWEVKCLSYSKEQLNIFCLKTGKLHPKL